MADPYVHSVQWARRFVGLKLFLSLATVGQPGYARVIDSQTALGGYLRRRLRDGGWKVENKAPLPVVCFSNPHVTEDDTRYYNRLTDALAERGDVWISTTRLRGKPVLRACITSYLATEQDVDRLIQELARAR